MKTTPVNKQNHHNKTQHTEKGELKENRHNMYNNNANDSAHLSLSWSMLVGRSEECGCVCWRRCLPFNQLLPSDPDLFARLDLDSDAVDDATGLGGGDVRVICGDGDDVFDVMTSDDGVVVLLLAAVWFNSFSSGYK